MATRGDNDKWLIKEFDNGHLLYVTRKKKLVMLKQQFYESGFCGAYKPIKPTRAEEAYIKRVNIDAAWEYTFGTLRTIIIAKDVLEIKFRDATFKRSETETKGDETNVKKSKR